MTYKHSICFSGSGFHYPWQIGVALYLQEHYDLSECCFLGTSGGSYVAARLAVELSIRDYIRTIVKESYAVFKKHFLGFVSHTPSRSQRHTSPKSTERDLQQGERKVIYFNNLLQKIPEEPNHKHVLFERRSVGSNLCLNSDPVHAVTVLFYKFRGERCLDGGFTHNWLRINDNTIMISPYQWSRMRYFYALSGLIYSSENNVYRLVQRGYDDAKANDAYFDKLSKKN